ncbi:MAG: glycosyl transferase family 1, partial [Bacteroidota bacterium]|nr:glycosyl transferase family 1 [Bacteroidota bacterium]
MAKKIVILGTAYPFRGGLAAYNERIARAYIERGDEVKIYTFTTQYPSIFFPGKSQFSDSAPPKGLNIQRIVNSVNPLSWVMAGNKICKEKPDIL